MKHFSAVIILFALLLSLCACGGNAETKAETPTDSALQSGSYSYALLEDGSVKITGYSCADEIITLEIPAVIEGHPVTVIGEKAFAGVQNVTVVNVPDSLTAVEAQAFYQSKIKKVFMHMSALTSIGAEAFSQCPELVQVDMPRSLTSIGDRAFAANENFSVAYFRGDVADIAGNAFDSCPAVKVYALDTYTSIIAYCNEHSLQTKITETEPTTEFVFSTK